MKVGVDRSSKRMVLLLATLPLMLACSLLQDGMAFFVDGMAMLEGYDSIEHKDYSECVDDYVSIILIGSDYDEVTEKIKKSCSEKHNYNSGDEGQAPENFAICGDGIFSQYEQDTDQCPEDGLGDDEIKIISIETAAPGGACSPPREEYDFICKYEVSWELAYASTIVPAALVCFNFREGERVSIFSLVVYEIRGTWEESMQISDFFPAMGEFPEQFVCEVRVPDKDGELISSDEKTIIAPLTTTWEE